MLPLLIEAPRTTDILDAMNVQHIRLTKDKEFSGWEPVLRAYTIKM